MPLSIKPLLLLPLPLVLLLLCKGERGEGCALTLLLGLLNLWSRVVDAVLRRPTG